MTVRNNGSKIVNIPADKLFVDKFFQRYVTNWKVSLISSLFNWKAFGIPVVAPRKDGTYSLLDGQSRFLAMVKKFGGTKIGGKPIMLRVEVRKCKDREEEARIFIEINLNQKNLSKTDFFHAGIAACDPAVKEILNILSSNGISISYGQEKVKPNQSRCSGVFMDAFDKLSKRKFKLLVKLLATCYTREDGFVEPVAMKAAFLRGLMYYLDNTNDTNAAIEKRLWSGDTATDIVAAAQQSRDATSFSGWKRPEIVAEFIGGRKAKRAA